MSLQDGSTKDGETFVTRAASEGELWGQLELAVGIALELVTLCEDVGRIDLLRRLIKA